MYRGTTPANMFNVDLDLTEAEAIYITYKQNGDVVLEKAKDDITVTADSISVILTQEDTLKFHGYAVYIQIRARFAGGRAVASNIVKADVRDVLKDGAI